VSPWAFRSAAPTPTELGAGRKTGAAEMRAFRWSIRRFLGTERCLSSPSAVPRSEDRPRRCGASEGSGALQTRHVVRNRPPPQGSPHFPAPSCHRPLPSLPCLKRRRVKGVALYAESSLCKVLHPPPHLTDTFPCLRTGGHLRDRGDGVVLAMPTTDISVLGRGGEGGAVLREGGLESKSAVRTAVSGTEGGVDNAVPKAASPSVSLLACHSAARL
jgi:hypothetical protein